jgi:hypothetical protein
MMDFTSWDKLQEFDIETAAKLWFASVNNVNLNEVPPPEHNPYYHRLAVGIDKDQLKIEDGHLDLAEQGIVRLTRFNLMKFFNASVECIPAFLLPQGYRWLAKEENPFKAWVVKALMEGKLDDNVGPKYWMAYLIEKVWPNFRNT